jgi:hypothetical protein
MLVEEFMHHQLTPLIDIDHKARNIPLLTERLTKEELEAGTLPYLVKKYKKTHKIIEEGQVKPRPKISEDLAAFYKQEFKADERPPSTIIIKDEKKKKKKKKAIKHETHDIQEEHIKIKQEPLDTDSLFEEELQNTTQDRPVAIKLEETQPDIQLRPKHKSSKRRNQSTDFYDNLNRTKSRKKSAKKTKPNKASMF